MSDAEPPPAKKAKKSCFWQLQTSYYKDDYHGCPGPPSDTRFFSEKAAAKEAREAEKREFVHDHLDWDHSANYNEKEYEKAVPQKIRTAVEDINDLELSLSDLAPAEFKVLFKFLNKGHWVPCLQGWDISLIEVE